MGLVDANNMPIRIDISINMNMNIKNKTLSLLAACTTLAFSGDDDEHALMVVGDTSFLPPSKFTDEDFDKLKSGAYLQRLQLMTSNSEMCKDGKFPANHYALIQDQEYVDLGVRVDVFVLAWRPKAIDLGKVVVESFDPDSETFKDIKVRSAARNSNCMWGFEFLVWVPAAEAFATLFFGSKTSRREGPNMKARLHGAVTLGSRKIDNGEYTWFGPTISDCSTPFAMPVKKDALEQIEKFENPPQKGPEIAEESATPERAQ